ncbi:MAG: MMPL family transporter, partial [Christensenellales bacterium]
NYSRLIFNINLSDDDEKALAFITELEGELATLCADDDFYIVCNSYNVIGMSQVFSGDKLKTDLITIIAILLIVLVAFRSISVPILLVLAIQGAIWINLGLNVLDGTPIFFVCYLLAMAIQMGATIDYGILLTDRYIFARRKENKFEAIKTAIDKSFVTVITSGLILILACFTIHFLSSMPLVADIGLLIGRGALISVITILFVLPQCLLLFDKLIEKTTLKTKFVVNTVAINNESIDEVVKNQQILIKQQEQDLKQLSEMDIEDEVKQTNKLDELREKGKQNRKAKKNKK